MHITLYGMGALVCLAVFLSLLWARTYERGPLIWLKGVLRRRRAEEGADRRELLARVQSFLPRAGEGNTVFSLYRESTTRGGSKIQITTASYDYKVFVADGKDLWVLPMVYDRRKKAYGLGSPVRLDPGAVRQVRLTGRPGRDLRFTFWIEEKDGLQQLDMVLAPYCFRKSSFWPFDLVQQDACEAVACGARSIACFACGLTPEDLEKERLKDECAQYGVYAACAGIFGVLLVPTESVPVVLACFGAALVLLGRIIAKGQIPKLSALVVLAAAAAAWIMMK